MGTQNILRTFKEEKNLHSIKSNALKMVEIAPYVHSNVWVTIHCKNHDGKWFIVSSYSKKGLGARNIFTEIYNT